MLTDEYARRCHAVSRLWALAQQFDGIAPDSRVVALSPGNPYAPQLNAAIAKRDSYRKTPRRFRN